MQKRSNSSGNQLNEIVVTAESRELAHVPHLRWMVIAFFRKIHQLQHPQNWLNGLLQCTQTLNHSRGAMHLEKGHLKKVCFGCHRTAGRPANQKKYDVFNVPYVLILGQAS